VETQAELDRFTDALSAVPDAEQCGWVKDRFGVRGRSFRASLSG
jgi:predicted 3-demethylubiquinone-9 3-methyltransferase (glyoxalase superfamily)